MHSNSAVALLAVLLCVSVLEVSAHVWLSSPQPRGQYLTPKKYSHEEYAPTAGNSPSNIDFVCRQDPVAPEANWVSLTAGQSVPITISWNAPHPGDCFVYLTYDADKPVAEMKWFKIWEKHECQGINSASIPIPDYLPSSTHVIFRWEMYALHVYPTVEFYAQCVDAKITGVSGGRLPSPQVNMPGHLPAGGTDNGSYRDPYNGNPPAKFFTGPVVATLDGATIPPSATVTPTTKAPTLPPGATAAPTVAPTNTPTLAPEVTAAPTAVPTLPGGATIIPTAVPTTPAPGESCTGAVGSESCQCTDGGGCDPGLSCVSKTCVDLSLITKESAASLSIKLAATFLLLVVVAVLL